MLLVNFKHPPANTVQLVTLFSSDWWLLTLHGLPVSCGSLASFSPISEYEFVDVCVWFCVCVANHALPRRGGILLRFPPSSPVHLEQSSSHVCHLLISLPLLMLGSNLQLSPGCWTKHVSATVFTCHNHFTCSCLLWRSPWSANGPMDLSCQGLCK